MSYLKQAQEAYRRRMAGQPAAGADSIADATHREESELCERTSVAPTAVPPVHDAGDPWAKPTGPCLACGQVRWRVWSDDGGANWQWICNGCRPLVVYNRDGRVWRSDRPPYDDEGEEV